MVNVQLPYMFKELERPHNFNSLHKGAARFLHDIHVVKDVKSVKAELRLLNKPMEHFCCWVEAKDNSFKEKIGIVVRPDTTGKHRAISVVIQIGTDVEVHNEDLDKGKSLKKTFKAEKQAIMHDIKKFILEELRKKHPKELAA